MLEVSEEARTRDLVGRRFKEMEREARAALRREGFDDARQHHERTVAARYRGQSFELEIEWADGLRLSERFHREHEARYGYAQSTGAVEIVSARLRSSGLVEKLEDEGNASVRRPGRTAEPHRRALVHFDEGAREVAVYRREQLRAGAVLAAPCVVTEYSSTTLVPLGARARIDGRLNLIIEL
jgi:N-methylhydantoinase A